METGLALPIAGAVPQLVDDPLLDVPLAEPKVSADAESRRPLPPIAPRVDGREGDTEVRSEVLDAQQPIELVHGLIVRVHPVSGVPLTMTPDGQSGLRSACGIARGPAKSTGVQTALTWGFAVPVTDETSR